jgi:anti-sigma regulatory factor (Ser/Thr protein kinase)
VPSRSFPAYAPSVPDVRRYVTDALGDLPADMREIAGLLVSELATNAVRHAGGQFGVQVQYTPENGLVWIGVTDTGPGDPVLQTPPMTAERGRGLRLVGTLADRWGMRRRRGTPEKTVWFELSAAGMRTPPSSPAAVQPPRQPMPGAQS